MLAAASLGPSTVIRSIRKRAGSGAGSSLQAGIPPARRTRRTAIARMESFNAQLLRYWPQYWPQYWPRTESSWHQGLAQGKGDAGPCPDAAERSQAQVKKAFAPLS